MGISNPALDTYLAPLQELFAEEGVNEISINRPCEAWVEKQGDLFRKEVPSLDLAHLRGLSNLIAQSTEQRISEEFPLLSGTLPNGFRIQIVLPPACESGGIIMSIRKPSSMRLTLDDYEKMGAFADTKVEDKADPLEQQLEQMIEAKQIKNFLITAILNKRNIIISGGTSTGKTTFTNAALCAIPEHERLITVEDAREVQLPLHPNRVHLLASKGGQGRAKVTTQDLIEACLRLRPDRIIVGELRGAEAFSFLRAINTGHPGSISTLHADSPNMAIEQLKLMVMQAGLGMNETQIRDYIINVVDIFVQLKRGEKGKRFISEILLATKLRKKKDQTPTTAQQRAKQAQTQQPQQAQQPPQPAKQQAQPPQQHTGQAQIQQSQKPPQPVKQQAQPPQQHTGQAQRPATTRQPQPPPATNS